MRLTISQRLDAFVLACGGYALVGAVLTLIGWSLSIPALINWNGDGISMKPNAAVCALFGSGALLLFLLRPAGTRWIRALAAVPLAIGLLTLLEHVTSVSLGIDTLLFWEPHGMRATAAPARMGPPMSVSSALLGLGVIAVTYSHRSFAKRLALVCGLVPVGLSLLAVTGHLYGADPLFAVTRLTGISFQAATMVLALGLGLTLALPFGPRRFFEDPSPTGALVRWALPLALVVPLLLGSLKESAEEFGLLDDDFGSALRTVGEVALLVGLIWWGSRRLVRNDAALDRRERELTDSFENSSVAMHWVSADGTILRANQAALELMGYSKAEVAGRNIAEFSLDRSVIEDFLGRLTEGGLEEQVSLQMRRKDGTVREVQIRSSAYFEDGQFVHIRCFIVDVTEQKLAERDRMHLAAIVEDSDDAIISKTLDGVISSWNLAAERLYGYKAAEAVGQMIDLIIPPNLLGEERSILEQLRKGNRIDHFETIRMHKNGQRVYVSLTVSPLRDRIGTIIGVSKIAHDITDRKLAESRLLAERQRVQILADAVPALISYVDTDFRYVLVNDAYEKWFSKPRIAFIGQHMRDVLGKKAWEVVRPHAEKALSGEVARYESEINYLNQPPRWIDVTYTPDLDVDGKVRGFVAHVNDITQRKKSEEELRVNRELAETLIRNLDVGTALIRGRDLRFIMVNEGYQSIAPDRGFVGKTVDEAWPETASQLTRRFRRVLETGEPIDETDEPHIIQRLRNKPPELVYFTWSAHRVLLPGEQGWGLLLSVYETTRRKHMEAALRESEQRFRGIVDQAIAGIAETDRTGRFLTVNDAYCEITGYDREELLSRRMQDITHPEDLPGNVERFKRCIETQEGFEVEKRFIRKDGRTVWVHNSVAPTLDAEGRVSSVVAVSVDLTTRKLAEERVERSLERQRILSEALAYLLSHHKLDDAIRGLFTRVATHLGVDTFFNFMADEHDQVLLLHSFAGVPADVARRIERIEFGQAICGTVAQIRKSIVASDIQHSTYDKADLVRGLGMKVYACFPLIYGARLLGTLSFASKARTHFADDELQFLQTIAHYAAAAIAQIRSAQELKRSKESISFLVERAPFGVYVVDSQFRIAMINAGSQARAFRNVNPAVGRDFAEAIRILWPEPVAREIIDVFRHTLATGEPYFSKDYVERRADSDEVESYEWELHRIVLPDGQYGVVCYYYESTMLRRAEQALRDSDRKKDEFLAILAHELRNPLAPLRNMLEILKRKPESDGFHRDALDMMDRQLNQMVRLIDDLLDINRISKGKIELRKEPCELPMVIRQAVENSIPSDQCNTHDVTIDIPDDPILLNGDPVRLTQVFANLLNNACKYTEPGGRIQLIARQEGDEVTVTVKDSGVGIPASKLDEVFELFAQVEQSLERSKGGLGIGLTLAKRLVDLHGGTITARSEGAGKGSEFVVRLPILKTADRPDPQSNGKTAPITPRRILVVDDNEDSARSMAMIMKMDGHETHVAFDGLTALESARSIKPDVALLDIGLPQLNGYELCRKLRNEPWGRQMVLIALTGWGQDSDRRQSQEAGFNAHLVKPVNLDDLSRLLEEFSAGTVGR